MKCTFTFTNEGNAPLVIHQAIASCGCTVPTYTRMPVKPGGEGQDGGDVQRQWKISGAVQKSIAVRTNAKEPMVKLYITGVMTASEKIRNKPMGKIRAVFFDIDGTLVSFKDPSHSPSTLDAVAALRSRGIKVYLATGASDSLYRQFG